jgi:hypothetical protein
MLSILHIVIWRWQIGCRIARERYTGSDRDTISGLLSSTRTISESIFDTLSCLLTIASTTLCLLHRAHMPPATAKPNEHDNVDMAYPSRTIAFQAAGMITSIVENLLGHDQIKYTPAFMYAS